MRRLSYIVHVLMLTILAAACSDGIGEQHAVNSGEGIAFEMTLSSAVLETKAVDYKEAGVDLYNENKIAKADIFLYSSFDGAAVYKVSGVWENAQTTAVVSASVPSDIVSALFGTVSTGTATCYAYAVVNGPETPSVGEDGTTIAELKALEIGGTLSEEPVASFVMDGQTDNVTFNADSKEIGGTILLDRAASKIAMFVTLKNFTDDEGNVWVPQTSGMNVAFYNGVDASRVNVGETGNDRTAGNYFSMHDDADDNSDDARYSLSATDAGTYTHKPFYSYSSDWGKDVSPDEEAYMTLRVYWVKNVANGDGTTTPMAAEPYYYRVPINLEEKKMERNMYYKVILEVGVLGDKAENTQSELTPSYIIVDWKTEPFNAQLSDYHYLIVDKNYVDVYNETSVTIGYTSCSDVIAEIVSISVPDFSTNTIGTINYNIKDSDNSETVFTVAESSTGTSTVSSSTSTLQSLLKACTLTVNQADKSVTLSHELQNDNSATPYDYAIYTIVIRLVTTDGCNLSEDITIKQYPARYIEGELDNNKNYSYTTSASNSRGTVFINGYGGNDKSEGEDWYWVNNTLSGTSGHNSNPNMYVITVTSFDTAQSHFIIADPRESTINNLSINTSAQALYGNSPRGLTYYYPTTDSNPNYIAPKFRTAAAYGRLSGGEVNSLDDVHRRCAAYQEYGYPAGRWRVPTAAELEYLGKLCSDGVIPALFNGGISYNSANGAYTYNNGSFTATNGVGRSVRCVYDEWYWQNKCDEFTFTWGDEPR